MKQVTIDSPAAPALPAAPFTARFAKPIPESEAWPARYDARREVLEYQIDGTWRDALDVHAAAGRTTRVTKVAQETAD